MENIEECNNLIVTLKGQDGDESEFELLDLIDYEGDEYVVLLPVQDEEASEVVILKLENSDGETDTYAGIENQNVIDAIFDIFKEKHQNEFNFVD